ncbi:MAG TPA: pentapeptide repeat-containing protein [Actinomycetota bacterium]|nr:pentapeptide repeat-containing protein [Actinomycetota bacterium]
MKSEVVKGASFEGLDVVAELGERAHRFISCSFRGAVVDDAAWTGVSFEQCDLTNARFIDSDLCGSRWLRCTGDRPAFGNCDLTEALFEGCDLAGAGFASISAADAAWRDCKLLNATFTDLQGFGWDFSSCVLMYADLRDLGFRKHVLDRLDLTESDLRGADFREASFRDVKLVRADIRGADFLGADLRGADLGPLDDLERLSALKGAIISPHQAIVVAGALGINVLGDD